MECEQWRIHSQLICIVQKHTKHKLSLKEKKAEEQMHPTPRVTWMEGKAPLKALLSSGRGQTVLEGIGRMWMAWFLE